MARVWIGTSGWHYDSWRGHFFPERLPPQFHANAERLASFFKLLPNKRRYSFEFRHPSWYVPQIFRMLSEQNISLCISDHHDAPAPWKRTADFVYVRGHGPGGRYKG